MASDPFDAFFLAATGHTPYDYQRRLAADSPPASEPALTEAKGGGQGVPNSPPGSGGGGGVVVGPVRSRLIHIPTGAGKTAAAILAWLWRLKVDRDNTPRRLIYCLPMRVLVEQTRDNARGWVKNLKSSVWPDLDMEVFTLMGGEVEEDWELYPEKPAILVGTQDMLLSRVLNRGYGMSRYKWPVHFGLLNNDCLWVCDEVQLMRSGLATSTQMQAFREQFGVFGARATWWMSATMDRTWLETVDYKAEAPKLTIHKLEAADLQNEDLWRKYNASKPLSALNELTPEHVFKRHVAGTLTLIVVNTVGRAQELYEALRALGRQPGRTGKKRALGSRPPAAETVQPLLIHSRFRPKERERQTRRLILADKALRGRAVGEATKEDRAWLEGVGRHGLIVISTQVIEAGVDVSAQTLITELAPWGSLVQRFGRCNRFGRQQAAQVLWVDLGKKHVAPYEEKELGDSRKRLKRLKESDAKIPNLEELGPPLSEPLVHVIRRHDLYGLFSTEPDLAGGFTDVSAFVRDLEQEAEVYVLWRDFEGKPGQDQPLPSRAELCHVPAWQLKDFLDQKGLVWEWDGEIETWAARRANDIRPGMTLMLNAMQGGYADDLGWTARARDKPEAIPASPEKPDAMNRDGQSETDWLPLIDHLCDAEAEARAIANELKWEHLPKETLIKAARWHDVGKSHRKWQDSVESCTKRVRDKIAAYSATDPDGPEAAFLQDLLRKCAVPAGVESPWAKFPNVQKAILCSGLGDDIRETVTRALSVQFRPGLRHEAASALAAWQQWQQKRAGWTALAVYLVAAHHGKVRTVLRSRLKTGDDVFGVRPADELPSLPGWMAEEIDLDLGCKVFGAVGEWDGSEGTFTFRQPSWVGVVAELLGPEFPGDPPSSVLPEGEPKRLGPFKVAFLEALIGVADVRASRQPGLGRG